MDEIKLYARVKGDSSIFTIPLENKTEEELIDLVSLFIKQLVAARS